MLISFSKLMLLCFSFSAFAEEPKILNIYTWSNYVPQSVIQQFEAETGIRVHHSTYVNNEALYAKLEANPEAPYDIIMPSSYFISRMRSHGLIQTIDLSKIPNHKHLNPLLLGRAHDPEDRYSLPYLWHSTGIALNTRYHPLDAPERQGAETGIQSVRSGQQVDALGQGGAQHFKAWADLWRPLKEQLFVLDDARELFGVALLTLGYSVNEQDPVRIEAAYQKLKKLMPNIKLFNTDAQQSIYLDEDLTLGMAWSGDLYLASLENAHLAMIYPEEGFIIALDSIAIPKGAQHVDHAHRFIDFLCRPEIAKAVSLETGYSTANSAALSMMPEALRHNSMLYPDQRTMKRGVFLMDVGRATAIYEKYYERLKLE